MTRFLMIAWPLLAFGCTPPDELDANDLGPTFDWPELTGRQDDEIQRPLPGETKKGAQLSAPPATPEILLSPERFSLLPDTVKARPLLASLAVSRALENPIDYQGGVYGLNGAAKVFVTTKDHIKDDNRLYWVMVKVLSEKYGCFMTSKVNIGDSTRVTCRDKRQIVFWRSRGDNWIQFLARQYDSQGYEIVVRKRKIVRISDEQILKL